VNVKIGNQYNQLLQEAYSLREKHDDKNIKLDKIIEEQEKASTKEESKPAVRASSVKVPRTKSTRSLTATRTVSRTLQRQTSRRYVLSSLKSSHSKELITTDTVLEGQENESVQHYTGKLSQRITEVSKNLDMQVFRAIEEISARLSYEQTQLLTQYLSLNGKSEETAKLAPQLTKVKKDLEEVNGFLTKLKQFKKALSRIQTKYLVTNVSALLSNGEESISKVVKKNSSLKLTNSVGMFAQRDKKLQPGVEDVESTNDSNEEVNSEKGELDKSSDSEPEVDQGSFGMS